MAPGWLIGSGKLSFQRSILQGIGYLGIFSSAGNGGVLWIVWVWDGQQLLSVTAALGSQPRTNVSICPALLHFFSCLSGGHLDTTDQLNFKAFNPSLLYS